MNIVELVFLGFNTLVLIATIYAIWQSPIKAVKIGRILQSEYEANERAYRNKFNVFIILIGERHAKGYSKYFVTAVNQIPIVFHKNDKLKAAYSNFIKAHKNSSQTAGTLDSLLNDLLVEMGKDLGYPQMNNEWMAEYFDPMATRFEFDASYYHNIEYLNSLGYYKFDQLTLDFLKNRNKEQK